MSNGTAMGWDSPIENDGAGGVILPQDSIADFEVTKLEKGVSEKKKAPMAILTLRLSNEHGSTTCLEHLVLHTDSEWKLCQFFRAIGQREHGQKFKPNWNKVVGTGGKCQVAVRTFHKKSDKPGEETGRANEVASFMDPNDAPAAKSDADETPAFG